MVYYNIQHTLYMLFPWIFFNIYFAIKFLLISVKDIEKESLTTWNSHNKTLKKILSHLAKTSHRFRKLINVQQDSIVWCGNCVLKFLSLQHLHLHSSIWTMIRTLVNLQKSLLQIRSESFVQGFIILKQV